MAADDRERGDDPGPTGPPRPAPSTREVALAFVVFLFLLGQPVVVFALALLSPGLPSLAIIGVGTVLLAWSVTRLFVRQGGSVDRLADFVLALAGVQLVLAVLGQLAFRVAAGSSLPLAAAPPVFVLVGYPVAYYVVYRGPPVAPLDIYSNSGK